MNRTDEFAGAPALDGAGPSPATDGSGAMFDGIAHRYDALNRILSLGIDQRWRRRTALALEVPATGRALDLATGTADLALLLANTYPHATLVGLDPSEKMLEVGRAKVNAAQLSERVELVMGDAQQLPFESNSFDATCIAFGIRNVPDRPRALAEMARVTRPSGRVAILELSEPRGGILGPLARLHVHTIVPFVGSLLSGAKEYRYLQRSIAAFPSADEFAKVMDGSGLEVLRIEPLTFGVAHLYLARPRA